MMKRVVITGMGIWSCLGKSLGEVCESLYNGKSGIVLDPLRKEMGFRSGLTAKVDVPDLKGVLSRSQRAYMPEQAKYAYCATVEALRNARIDQDYLDTHDVGLLYGNDSAVEPAVRAVDTIREKRDTTLCGSVVILAAVVFFSVAQYISKAKSATSSIKEHNEQIDTVTAEIDSILS
jgi:3-oxoacyl-[acyl-carrier-protein] synthase-1